MNKRIGLSAMWAAGIIAATTTLASAGLGSGSIKRVLLISIDGFHAVDFQNCAKGISGVNDGGGYCPNLAALAAHGVNYVNPSTRDQLELGELYSSAGHDGAKLLSAAGSGGGRGG